MAKIVAKAKQVGSGQRRRVGVATGVLILAFSLFASMAAVPQTATMLPPKTLQETGLYSDSETLQINPQHLSFAPQYPLWSDGATKRRWISLPPGAAIDGSDPDAWIFPVGTRLWKEFSFNGQKVETRYLERRTDGQWLYAAYAWSADGREAPLVGPRGKRGAYPLAGGRSHTIPGVADCKACHQGGPSEVLGFGTLQLSSERDSGAPHAELQPEPHVDLKYLLDRGLLIGLPKALLDAPPRIASRSPALQMPPLGTELIDDEAVRLLYRWIEEKGASIQQAHANAEGR